MKRWLKAIKKMQIKITLKYHFTCTRTALTKKS
jgi:hypothetical protein